MLWIAVEHIVVELFEKSVDTGSWSGISVESYTRSQNQGIPGQPGVFA